MALFILATLGAIVNIMCESQAEEQARAYAVS